MLPLPGSLLAGPEACSLWVSMVPLPPALLCSAGTSVAPWDHCPFWPRCGLPTAHCPWHCLGLPVSHLTWAGGFPQRQEGLHSQLCPVTSTGPGGCWSCVSQHTQQSGGRAFSVTRSATGIGLLLGSKTSTRSPAHLRPESWPQQREKSADSPGARLRVSLFPGGPGHVGFPSSQKPASRDSAASQVPKSKPQPADSSQAGG